MIILLVRHRDCTSVNPVSLFNVRSLGNWNFCKFKSKFALQKVSGVENLPFFVIQQQSILTRNTHKKCLRLGKIWQTRLKPVRRGGGKLLELLAHRCGEKSE